MGFLLKKNVNSVLKVMKSEPVGREQGKRGIQHGVSTSGFLRLREALQHRTCLSQSLAAVQSIWMEEWFRFCFFFYTFCILDCSLNNATLQNFLNFRFGFSILRTSKLEVPTPLYAS